MENLSEVAIILPRLANSSEVQFRQNSSDTRPVDPVYSAAALSSFQSQSAPWLVNLNLPPTQMLIIIKMSHSKWWRNATAIVDILELCGQHWKEIKDSSLKMKEVSWKSHCETWQRCILKIFLYWSFITIKFCHGWVILFRFLIRSLNYILSYNFLFSYHGWLQHK